MTVLWVLAGAGCAVVMIAASRIALRHAIGVSQRLGIPPFLIGFTLVAIGTDLPEIANSIVSAYLQHGDVSLGDEVGSVFTQGTLVLGLFPFIMMRYGRRFEFARRDVVLVSTLTIVALVIGIALTQDGHLSRIDGAGMLLVWVAAWAIAWRYRASSPQDEEHEKTSRSALSHAAIAVVALGIVGFSAVGLVQAIVNLSSALGVPEYVISFFGASLGTSMPELAVEITALRRGQTLLALGDILGSCLVDASLAIGIGPLLFPVDVTASLALRGALVAIAAMAAVALLLGIRGKLLRSEGLVLIGVYLVSYAVFFGFK